MNQAIPLTTIQQLNSYNHIPPGHTNRQESLFVGTRDKEGDQSLESKARQAKWTNEIHSVDPHEAVNIENEQDITFDGDALEESTASDELLSFDKREPERQLRRELSVERKYK